MRSMSEPRNTSGCGLLGEHVLHQLRGPFRDVSFEPTQVDIVAAESAFLSKITATKGGDSLPWPFSSHQIVVEAAKHLIRHSD